MRSNNLRFYSQAIEDAQLLLEAGNAFDEEKIAAGKLTPVFFGSALTGFGVQTFLDAFVDFAPSPSAKKTESGELIDPLQEQFTGFIFKIQANMNPAHRDRIAFVRICSGEFTPGMDITVNRSQKKMKLSHTTQFMADSRETVKAARSRGYHSDSTIQETSKSGIRFIQENSCSVRTTTTIYA